MAGQVRYRWQSRQYLGLKLLGAGLTAFAVSYLVTAFFASDPFAVALLLPFALPLATAPVMFGLAFVEQRLPQHAVASLLSTFAAMLPPWLRSHGMWPGTLGAPGAFVLMLAMWLVGLLASKVGIRASQSRYTIIMRSRGHCPGCGYCLAKLVEQVCPECGRAFTLEETGMVRSEPSGEFLIGAADAPRERDSDERDANKR